MRFVVSDGCIGCGLCVSICPEVFVMGEGGQARARDMEAEGELRVSASSALRSCPVSAIGRQMEQSWRQRTDRLEWEEGCSVSKCESCMRCFVRDDV